MKKSTVILIWGLVTGVASVLLYRILDFTGNTISGWHYLGILIVFLGLFVGIRQYRDKVNGGYLRFGEGYVVGLIMTAIIMVIDLASVIIVLQITPDLPGRILNEMHVVLINAGYDSDKIDKAMKYYSTYVYTPRGMIINAIVGNILIGAIIGLIAAGLNAKKKPMFDDNEMADGSNADFSSQVQN